MEIKSARFGDIVIADDKIIVFEAGILGFEHLTKFALVTMDRLKPFHFLQAIDDFEVALSVINVLEVIETYSPMINNQVLENIGLEDDNDLIVLAAVVMPKDLTKMTANLAAPILINTKNNMAVQTILDHDEYEMRYHIYDILCQKLGRGNDYASDNQKEE